MRIAFIAPFYPYPPSIGGVETIVRYTSYELAHRGHEVFIITTPYDVTTLKEVSEYGVEEKGRVTVYKLKPSFIKVGYARVMKDLKKVLWEVQPDIVHSHNLHPHLFQASKCRGKLNYKLVAQLHHPKATGIDHMSARLAYCITIWYLKRIQSSIDMFIAHTNLERDWLIACGIEQTKIRKVTYPCVPSSLQKYGLKQTNTCESTVKYKLLFIGRITWRKGIHVLLKALPKVINQIEEVVIIIAGARDKNYYETLLKLTYKLNLNNFVIFKHRLSEQEKYDQMLDCTIFVLPSIKEYTPVGLLEAQTLGKPVVTTSVGAIPEIVIHGKTGLLVKPNNPEELAEAIVTLLQNESLRMTMSFNARKLAKNFVLEKTVDRLERLYHQLLQQGRPL